MQSAKIFPFLSFRYLLKIIGSGENVRLQYRSLRKILSSEAIEDRCASQPIQNSS
jgi:hypothetical protein